MIGINGFKERRRRPRRAAPSDDIQADLTRLNFRKLAPTVIIGGVVLVGSNALLAYHFSDPWLWSLTRMMGEVCCARILIVVAFSKRRKPDLSLLAANLWTYTYALATFLFCCTAAASTLYNFRFHDASAQAICTIGTFSLCAALSARIGLRPWIPQLCGFIMLGALGISVIRPFDLLARAGFVLLCFFAYAHWEGVKTKFEVVVEQLQSRRHLRTVAEHDALTGLANRRSFEERLATLCANAETFGILYMDLDRFKQVNDTWGHNTGDALLKQVADRLRSVIRGDQDLLARLGGDEFAIIQTCISGQESAEALARRIHKVLAPPIYVEGRELRISASIGARISSGSFNNPRIILGRADAALYRVKQAGGADFALAED